MAKGNISFSFVVVLLVALMSHQTSARPFQEKAIQMSRKIDFLAHRRQQLPCLPILPIWKTVLEDRPYVSGSKSDQRIYIIQDPSDDTKNIGFSDASSFVDTCTVMRIIQDTSKNYGVARSPENVSANVFKFLARPAFLMFRGPEFAVYVRQSRTLLLFTPIDITTIYTLFAHVSEAPLSRSPVF